MLLVKKKCYYRNKLSASSMEMIQNSNSLFIWRTLIFLIILLWLWNYPLFIAFQQWLQFSLINLGIHNWTRMFWHIIASWISCRMYMTWPMLNSFENVLITTTQRPLGNIVELKKVAWYLINWRKYHPLESQVETQWL